jgi:hypothetical protein
MNEIDSPAATRPPRRPDRALWGAAAAAVLAAFLLITLVVAPSPGTSAQATPEPSAETFTPGPALVAPTPTPTPTASTAPSVAVASPSPVPVASPSLAVDPNHVATRVRIPDLRVDLAVVAPPKNRQAYPKCGVAMYLAELHQPGDAGATYLYAHARAGMFLPIYERAIQKRHGGPKSMLGLAVEVYTSDDLRYLYTIDEVRVHQTTATDAERATTSELWLQTSEGPKGTRGKTQLHAVATGVTPAEHAAAHPVAKPVTCG